MWAEWVYKNEDNLKGYLKRNRRDDKKLFFKKMYKFKSNKYIFSLTPPSLQLEFL